METVSDFIFLGSRITADGDCSHKIKRHLLLGRITRTNLDSVLKSRDIALPTKFHTIKAMVFPVVVYGCESWTIKTAECQRIDDFELWCWRRLFFFFKLYIILLVLPNIKMNPPQVYMCSPSWTLLPPHSIPLGRPSAPAPSIQYCASNLDWQLVSYIIFYMFKCHSPKSSHLLPLSQSP